MLYEAIEQESSPQLRKFLLGAFTSMIHLCTRMCPALSPGEGNHQTAFSSHMDATQLLVGLAVS